MAEIQSIYIETRVNTSGYPGTAHGIENETIPICTALLPYFCIKGPPESPFFEIKRTKINKQCCGILNKILLSY